MQYVFGFIYLLLWNTSVQVWLKLVDDYLDSQTIPFVNSAVIRSLFQLQMPFRDKHYFIFEVTKCNLNAINDQFEGDIIERFVSELGGNGCKTVAQ